MDKKIVLISIFAAVLIILFPLSSVVGTHLRPSSSQPGASPLFTTRINTFIQQESTRLTPSYLGKGKIFTIFVPKTQILDRWMDKAMQLIHLKPALFDQLIDQLDTIPALVNIIQDNNLNINDVKTYLTLVKHNPTLLQADMDQAMQMIGEFYDPPLNDPEPLGFSGQPGCLIAFFIVFPIFLMIAVMVATFTIITCLNIRGCFETILQNLMDGLQGLTPP